MNCNNKKVLLVAMPFAGTNIPSIQLAILESFLREHGIDVISKHLYLKAAELYGVNNYNHLINKPCDSYTAQMVYSKYVFPDHWSKTEYLFREYFDRILNESEELQQNFSFEKYVDQTDQFYNWVFNNIDWNSFDLIGFTCNYGQFLPSLAIAKKIKELFPDKKIVFGGSRTTGELGKRVLKSFEYIDYIVSGDGEEALFSLAASYENLDLIPNLIYRSENGIIFSSNFSEVDLNSLSFLTFDSFFNDLNDTSDDVKQYFYYYGRLPVEISRGCWWNKCTFCNHSIQYKSYREKKYDKIIEEIDFLSNKYKILDFHLIGYNLIKKDTHLLIDGLNKLDKDLNFIVEFRADQLKSGDYRDLKDAGFTIIQTGIESYSKNYLKKMKKGVNVINNISALKYCKENRIFNRNNIIINYPNEEKIDFEETKKNIEFIKHYLDPPNINNLLVGYGSPIYDNPEMYNIEELDYTKIDKLIFPEEYLKEDFCFFYDFKRKEPISTNDWKTLIDEWELTRRKMRNIGIRNYTETEKLVFYFVDGKKFLKIIDKRFADNVRIYNLDEIEREVFLSCIDIISYDELSNKLSHIPDYQLVSILRTFVNIGIVFVEDDSYLSLPLNYRKCVGIIKEKIVNSFVEEELIK